MKKLLLILLIPASLISKAQINSSCNVPPELTLHYHADIVRLATNYLFQTQSPDTIFVRVPQPVIDEISGGLAAILNAPSLPESDSVFNLYCVHNYNGWPYENAGLLVQVDTTYSWTQAWQNLVTVTGNAYLDSLTSQYAMHITNFYNWSFGNYAELAVDSAWNIMALMDSLSYTPGIIFVEPNGIIGLAGKIEYVKSGTDRYYDFFFEFNDCFDGCDNYHQWSFRVDIDCNVYYLGFNDWGVFGISPLPAPINCNLFTAIQPISWSSLEVYPNPVTGRLTVRTTSEPIRSVSIYSTEGRLIKTLSMDNATSAVISCEELSPGIYFAEITLGNSTTNVRFVKE